MRCGLCPDAEKLRAIGAFETRHVAVCPLCGRAHDYLGAPVANRPWSVAKQRFIPTYGGHCCRMAESFTVTEESY